MQDKCIKYRDSGKKYALRHQKSLYSCKKKDYNTVCAGAEIAGVAGVTG